MARKSKFVSANDISPFALIEYKAYVPAPVVTEVMMAIKSVWRYEWNHSNQKWDKLNELDPEPPETLAKGKFDGQIIEVLQDK